VLGWSLQLRGKTWYVYHRINSEGKLVGITTGKQDHEEALQRALELVQDARATRDSGELGSYMAHITTQKLKAREEEILLGNELDKTNPRMTTLWKLGATRHGDTGVFRDWVSSTLSTHEHYKMRVAWKMLVTTHPDLHRIHDVTGAHIEKCLELKRAVVSELSLVNYWSVAFRSLFKRLISLGYYHKENPCPSLGRRLERTRVNTTDVLTPEELKAIAEIFEERDPALGMLAQLAIHTGMRKSEITNLRWEDVDLDRAPRPIIHVQPHAENKELGVQRNTLKTRHSVRVVPMKKELIEYMMARRKSVGYVVDSERYKISREFFRIPAPVQKRASEVCTGFHLHLLRHTFISRALMAGQPPVKVAKWVGDSVQMILDTYTHCIPDDSIDDF